MSSKLNESSYQKLVDEDVAWLKTQPRTLEREHIIKIVEDSVRCYYDAEDWRDEAERLLAGAAKFMNSDKARQISNFLTTTARPPKVSQ